jgi:hypothetical protein
MSGTGLIVVDPGHFHAALVQKEMYPNLSPRMHVYAPVGPDLADYLSRIVRRAAGDHRRSDASAARRSGSAKIG